MTAEFVTNTRFHESVDYSSPMRYVISHLRRHWFLGITLVIGAFANAALASLLPIFTGIAFEAVSPVTDESLNTVLVVVIGVVLSQSVRAVLQLMRNFSSEIYAQRVERDVRDDLFGSLLGKSMQFHDRQSVGDIMARVTNDVREMNLMMNPGLNLIIGSSMFLFLPLIVAPLLYPPLILVPLVFVIVNTSFQYWYIRRLHPRAQKVRHAFGEMNGRLAEALEGIQVVKSAAQEAQEVQLFDDLALAVRDRYIEQGRFEARFLSFLFLGIAMVAAVIHSSVLYAQGLISIGVVIAFIGQIMLFGFPVFSSQWSFSRVANGFASAGRILSVITSRTEIDRNDAGHAAPLKGAISFRNVTFGYQPGADVLHDVSFDIQPGQTVALVGQTGAGKTTVTKLINRIYDIDAGQVLVDGVDVRDWQIESLRSQISVIEQDIFLFSRSIADNIAFGHNGATREAIMESARKAQAHDFIMGFPEQYDTVVGQRGVTLSGGQRQRLAIARAFQSDPPVLILDDSTSAIDSATEDRIQKAIWVASRDRTTILITHRLSQIRWADHIVVFRKGRVVAQGSHDDLIQTSDAYRRIFARYESPLEAQAGQHIPAMGED
jgi:ATP-binding cassette, subfamily B, bacterial